MRKLPICGRWQVAELAAVYRKQRHSTTSVWGSDAEHIIAAQHDCWLGSLLRSGSREPAHGYTETPAQQTIHLHGCGGH